MSKIPLPGPVDSPSWHLEIEAAKQGDRNQLISSLRAGKLIDTADNADAIRDTIVRLLSGELKVKRRGNAGGRTREETLARQSSVNGGKLPVHWGINSDQYIMLDTHNDRHRENYRAAMWAWQQQRDGSDRDAAVQFAATRFKMKFSRLDNWMRRPGRIVGQIDFGENSDE